MGTRDGKGGHQSVCKARQGSAFLTQRGDDAEIVVAKGVPKVENL